MLNGSLYVIKFKSQPAARQFMRKQAALADRSAC